MNIGGGEKVMKAKAEENGDKMNSQRKIAPNK